MKQRKTTATSTTPSDAQKMRRPIDSLIRKMENAQRKLAAGTWQHAMLRDQLDALRLASNLMNTTATEPPNPAANVLQKAIETLASLIRKTEQAQAGFSQGTAQYTLLRNRLTSLRLAKRLVKMKASGRMAHE